MKTILLPYNETEYRAALNAVSASSLFVPVAVRVARLEYLLREAAALIEANEDARSYVVWDAITKALEAPRADTALEFNAPRMAGMANPHEYPETRK